MNDFLLAAVQSMLPAALEQLRNRPADEIVAAAEKAVREYVPDTAQRAQLVALVRRLVERFEVAP